MSRGLSAFTAFAVLSLSAPPAAGYRLYGETAESAFRWESSKLPLRFHMLENGNLPSDVELDGAGWAALAARSVERWVGVPTAEVRAELDPTGVALEQADASDGVNTIGFSSNDTFVDSWVTAFAAIRMDEGEAVGCDIEINPAFRKNWSPQDPARLLEVIATHELGHCFGLAHSEPHPMPLWTDAGVEVEPSFLPDPVMSYTNSYGLELTEDDRVGVSLLYPAAGFLESRAVVEGRITLDGWPAPYVYVQSVRPGDSGARAGPGPGAFANEWGVFRLEGLEPGNWILWVHPMLVVRRNAHGGMLEVAAAAGVQETNDRWRFVEVAPGEVLTGVDVRLTRGREVG